MRVAFICGSLELGHDGVGDYTRTLACELIRQGHETVAIALNDRSISSTQQAVQVVGEQKLEVLRIASGESDAHRYSKLKDYLLAAKPDWVSLQYVPFSYHPKGLAYGVANELVKLKSLFRWHIMFHELWVGVNGTSTVKMGLLKFLQRRLIEGFIKRMGEVCISTSIPLYQQQFAKGKMHLLPLFSNIPVKVWSDCVNEASQQWFTAVHFGSFSSAIADFEAQLRYLKKVGELVSKQTKFVAIGNGGSTKIKSLEIAANLLGTAAIIEKGYLTESEISAELLKADIGVSRADVLFFGKSGSTMAMLEHGLPVLLRGSSEGTLPSISNNALYKDRLCFVNLPVNKLPAKQKPENALPKVASEFIKLLITHT